MRILENDEWDSSMTVEGYTPAKPEDRAEPSQVYWDGQLEFTGLALPAGLHVNDVTGRLGCRGPRAG